MTEKAILEEVVDGYAQRDIPLNVVVLDMEWHGAAWHVFNRPGPARLSAARKYVARHGTETPWHGIALARTGTESL